MYGSYLAAAVGSTVGEAPQQFSVETVILEVLEGENGWDHWRRILRSEREAVAHT